MVGPCALCTVSVLILCHGSSLVQYKRVRSRLHYVKVLPFLQAKFSGFLM